MSLDISALKVLIKKVFPPKKSIYTVDTTGDGKADALLIKALNLIMPILVPKEIELGGFSTKSFDVKHFDGGFSTKSFDVKHFELSDYGKMFLDEIPIYVSKKVFDVEKLKDHFTLYHKGERFTIDDLLSGNLAGRMIALGFSEGKHTFKFKSEIIPTLEFNFELGKENLNQNFDSVHK
jgi:hypothetical protein